MTWKSLPFFVESLHHLVIVQCAKNDGPIATVTAVSYIGAVILTIDGTTLVIFPSK